ncbi:hypothetical protein HZC33_02630 [Candidatus Wolfebacteria bacterium]|nr:hypothetical protein [Candidatus Wolfebacteria bacterium]
MYNFILQIVIMLSLGIMVYLIGRGTPRVKNAEISLSDDIHARLDKLIAKIPFEKMDIFLSVNLEKFLRKVKLSLIKWDNLLTKHLEKLKHANESPIMKKEERPHIFASSETIENQENKGSSAVKFDDIQNKEENNE